MYLCHAYGEDGSVVFDLCCHMRNMGITLFDSCIGIGKKPFIGEKSSLGQKEQLESDCTVIILLSDYLCEDVTALYELNHIKNLFEKGQINVFTLEVKEEFHRLPDRLRWLSHTQYFVLNSKEELHDVILSAVGGYLQDMQQEIVYNNVNKADIFLTVSDLFIIEMLRMNQQISIEELKSKITMVYTFYDHLQNSINLSNNSMF